MDFKISWWKVLGWLVIAVAFGLLTRFHWQGVPFTHDGENHLARFANYKVAVREGHIPPRWAPNFLNHHGYPVFNYNYPLANILSLPFSAVDLSYQLAFQTLVITFTLGGIAGIWLWLSELKLKWPGRQVAIISYLLAPYLHGLYNYRGSIGEILALPLLVWLLWLIEKRRSIKAPKIWWWIVTISVGTAFGLSHNITVLFGGIFIASYAIVRLHKNWLAWRDIVLTGSASLGLAAWFWIPAILEQNLVNITAVGLTEDTPKHTLLISELLFGSVRAGFSLPGTVYQLSAPISAIGIFSLMLLCAGLALKKIKSNSIIWWSLGVIFLLILLQTNWSKSVWELAVLSFIQFPWRLSLLLTIALLPVVAWIFENVTRAIKILLLLLLVWQAIGVSRLSQNYFFTTTAESLDNFSQTSTTKNENLPKSFTYQGFTSWQPEPQIITGTAKFEVEHWNGFWRKYKLEVLEQSTIAEPTAYFPGWVTFANDQKLEYVDSEVIGGRVAYSLPAGNYNIETSFSRQTWPRLLGNSITILTFLLSIFLLYFKSKDDKTA